MVDLNKFIVNSAILPEDIDPVACATGIPEMLEKQGITNVKVKSCYCCEEESKVIFVADAPNKELLFAVLAKINLPVASIMKTKEVKPK